MRAGYLAFRKRNWDGRAPGERRAIMLLAWILLPMLAYFLAWQPARGAVAKLRISVPAMRSQAALMRDQTAEVAMLGHAPHPAVLDANALKSVVEASAEQHQIRAMISTLEVEGGNSVHITLDSVSFRLWLDWLRDLQQEQHVRVDSAGIAALPQPGLVKINASLTNGGQQ